MVLLFNLLTTLINRRSGYASLLATQYVTKSTIISVINPEMTPMTIVAYSCFKVKVFIAFDESSN